EAGDADDALARRCPLRHAGQCRPHLAGDAQNNDIARKPGKVGDKLGGGLAQAILELGHVGEAFGQWGRAHAAFPGCAGTIRPFGAAGILRAAAKSTSAPAANPEQASEESANCPSWMSRRVRPAERT